jgi:hypothetical protein
VLAAKSFDDLLKERQPVIEEEMREYLSRRRPAGFWQRFGAKIDAWWRSMK